MAADHRAADKTPIAGPQGTEGRPLWPAVSVIIPICNERAYLDRLVASMKAQSYPVDRREFLLVDGGSDDGTIEYLAGLNLSGVKVLHNPRKIVPCAMNLGLTQARGEIIVRWDAHTEYAPDYLERVVELLLQSGAECVGGPMRAATSTPFQEAVALATSHPFGVGNSRFHYPEFEGQADTVYLGAWPRQVLEKLGGFDENFVRNQDDELSFRICLAGGTILVSPGIRSLYHPRGSLGRLWSQYFQYGMWKVAVIRKHRQPASWRHLVPAALVCAVASGLLGLINPWLGLLGAGSLAAYLLALAYFSWRASDGNPAHMARLAAVFACLHWAYGTGFIWGMWRFGMRKRPA
ncbi:MAG: glycosyltransferase family 2 protein [Desulfobaccales bacterium]